MTCIETPRVSFSLPDIGEAAARRLASYKSHARCIRGCHDRLKPHDESKVTIDSKELNLSDVGRARHKCIHKCPFVSNHFVIWLVSHKLI